jgi:isopentenyl-diphosphate Delta-isomerase
LTLIDVAIYLEIALMEERVILVDESDNAIGSAEKLQAHRDGKLHRAFSIFVFNPAGELLLQKRSSKKYHSDGLWSNTCCSHPRPGVPMETEVRRRLRQEMGFECELQWVFRFDYRVELKNNLIEHEIDHVFIGRHDGNPVPNPDEVEDWKWMSLETLINDVNANPQNYSYWLTICLDQVLEFWVAERF